jgi:hypothetical protein
MWSAVSGGRPFLNDGKGCFAAPWHTHRRSRHQCAQLLDGQRWGLDVLASQIKHRSVPSRGDSVAGANRLWNNNRDGSWKDVAESLNRFGRYAVSSLVSDDFDNDRDLDLILFREGAWSSRLVNDQAGAFRLLEGAAIGVSVQSVTSGRRRMSTGRPPGAACIRARRFATVQRPRRISLRRCRVPAPLGLKGTSGPVCRYG